MKKLIIARHAKSSWDNPEWTDFGRPLNKRGLKDAPVMAEIIKEMNFKPDIIISSPANRAITTAKIFAEIMGLESNIVTEDRNIYEKGTRYIINMVKNLPDEINTAMIFGHNPDITSLSTYFSGEYFDNVPTCGTIGIEFSITKWEEVELENGKLLFFEYPKKLKKVK